MLGMLGIVEDAVAYPVDSIVSPGPEAGSAHCVAPDEAEGLLLGAAAAIASGRPSLDT